MVLTKGSGLGDGARGQNRPGLAEDRIRELIFAEVVTTLRGSIEELFGSIKTAKI